MLKGSTDQDDKAILNVDAPNNRDLKYMQIKTNRTYKEEQTIPQLYCRASTAVSELLIETLERKPARI